MITADDTLAVLLAGGYSPVAAGAMAKVSPWTVRRRLKDPAFARKVEDAQREIRERLMHRIVEDLTGQLTGQLPPAGTAP
jgi:hypothetical protein